jgi:branched-chain amino acid transport system permease protein
MKNFRLSMGARYGINTALLAVLVLGGSLIVGSDLVSDYYTKVMLSMGINVILAVSLNVTTGYLGQLPLGHAGFMAVGAYTGGILLKAMETKSLVGTVGALLAAGVVAAIFGILIGVPALRLKGDYLAIITLGFGEIIRVVLTNIDSVLGFKLTYGASGLKRIPKISTFTLVLACVIVTCTVIHMVMKSRHGRAILAIRENEIAAEACGVPVTYYKVFAFSLSAFFAGLAGCLYSGYIGSLQPGVFGFMKSIEILVMVVLGGRGSMLGSVLAACVLTVLPELMRGFDDLRMVMYSVVLIVMMLFRPEGLLGSYDFSMSRLIEQAVNKLKGGRKA